MTTKEEAKVREFIGKVPPEMAVVVVEDSENGQLRQHGDMCHIYTATIHGNMLNLRCLGAKSSTEDGKVFVAWKETRESGLKVVQYSGQPILPDHDGLF
ncbi:MAG: hypothetical protein RBS77_00475 [Candidatus Moranbacteria bacterium]|jgi:hypothetical protein|nr:hypothetical protein [Candidatus Moranbacteria bacterium]